MKVGVACQCTGGAGKQLGRTHGPYPSFGTGTGSRSSLLLPSPEHQSCSLLTAQDLLNLWLCQEIEKMLAKGALEIVPDPGPGFYSRLFLVEKATGGWRPVIDLSTLNTFIRQTPFKMETVASVLNAVQENDLLASLDLKDAYFQVPVHPSSRKFLRFVSQGTVYQFRVLCFGLSTAPQVFTRVFAAVSVWAHSRGIRLLRYLDDWLVLASSETKARQHVQDLLLLCHDLGIVVNKEKSDLTPSRSASYLGMTIDTVAGKVSPSRARVEKFLRLAGNFVKINSPPCSAVGGAPRTSLIAREAGSPRSSAVALHAVATEDVLVSRGRSSRSPSRVDSGDSRGPVLVDRGVPSSPGGSIRDSSSGSSSVHGRLLCGLGRSPARPKGVREVVGGGANVAHQSSRDEGGLARTAIFSEDSHRPSSDGNVRQLDGSSVCQQARRNAFSFHVRADKSPSQMDRGHRCPFGSEIPARTEQRPSGSLKPSGSGHCYGVDSPPSGGEGTPELVGLAVDRPVRVETQRSATGLLLPSPGRPGGSRGCVSASLGQPGRVRVSTLCSAREGSVTSTAVSKLFDDSGSSSLGRQGLVRGSTAPADASTSRSASVGRRRSPAPQRSTPPRRPRVETSHVATVKQLLRKSGFSRGAASDMSRCVRESTSNVYQSKWLAFCNWCRGRGVAPVSASVPLIVDFFRHLVRDKGLSVPAVRGYRASLNSVFALKGRDLAASREVSMLFRSFSNTARPERLRPPNWDVSLVLQSLTRAPYEPLRSADERFLAQKTLVLIALASAKRIGELHALSYRVSHLRAWGEVSFVFVPGFVAKTQDPSSQDPRFDSFTIPALPKARDNPNGRLLCLVRAVKLYLRRTAPHRPACERLFLTTGPNPKEIAKNTISFWLRKTIARAYELAGRSLPVPAPRARETRGIALSLLYRKNFALPQVLSAGTWRRHTTFTRHYLRDLAHKSLDTYHLGPVVAAQALV